MEVQWNPEKNRVLLQTRGVCFEMVLEKILTEDFLGPQENPARPGQQCVLLRIRAYIWVVPYVIDEQDRVVLKTAYPSRKYNRIYGD